jgi:hypothetical protein
VIVLNGLGFIREGRAEKALDSIRNMLSTDARTVRGGETRMLPAEQLVPGDLVLLESGDKIPADLRLLEAKNLRTAAVKEGRTVYNNIEKATLFLLPTVATKAFWILIAFDKLYCSVGGPALPEEHPAIERCLFSEGSVRRHHFSYSQRITVCGNTGANYARQISTCGLRWSNRACSWREHHCDNQ